SRNDGQLALLPQIDQMGLSLLHRQRTDSSQDLNLHRIRNSLFSSPLRYAAPPITQPGGEVTDHGARSPVLTLCRPAVRLETSDSDARTSSFRQKATAGLWSEGLGRHGASVRRDRLSRCGARLGQCDVTTLPEKK